MKIALIADPHLSDIEATPQEEALNWALGELLEIKPDACVWLGDITACGSPDAAMRFRRKLEGLPFTSVTVPGNSDLRTSHTASIMERYLLSHLCPLNVDGISIVGMDTSRNKLLPEERERLLRLELGERIILCSHQPAKYLDAESLEFLKNWIRECQARGKEILLWASGHRHVHERGVFEGVPALSVRALDLDKCIGGSAQIYLFDTDNADNSSELVYSRSLPDFWTEEERLEFADDLGAEDCDRQYRLGDALLVAPVMREDDIGEYYLPEGEWTHLLTGKKAEKTGWRREAYDFFSLPLFVRENTLLAIGQRDDRADYAHEENVVLQLYALTDKAECTVRNHKGEKAFSVCAVKEKDAVSIRVQGEAKGLRIQLVNVHAIKNLSGAAMQQHERGLILNVEGDQVNYQL